MDNKLSIKLDRTKPFGTVYGIADHRYEQNGLAFDNNGNCVSVPTAEQFLAEHPELVKPKENVIKEPEEIKEELDNKEADVSEVPKPIPTFDPDNWEKNVKDFEDESI